MRKIVIGLVLICLLWSPSLVDATITFTNGFWSTSYETCPNVTTICERATVLGYEDPCANYHTASPASEVPGYGFMTGCGWAGDFNMSDPDLLERGITIYSQSLNYSSGAGGSALKYFMTSTTGGDTKTNYIFTDATCHFSLQQDYATVIKVGPTNCAGTGDSGTVPGTTSGRCTIDPVTCQFDGNWHYRETHARFSGSDIVVRMWIDGIYMGSTTFGHGGATSFSYFYFWQSPKSQPYQSYVIFDDIAIATPSYQYFVQDSGGRNMIGPLGGGTTPPTAKGLIMKGATWK
jgi:hypothetical protein